MESGDIDTAISLFNEGLKIKHDRIDLVSNFHLGLSKAYGLKLNQSSSASGDGHKRALEILPLIEPFLNTCVQRTVVPPQEIHHSTSAPTEMMTVQRTVVPPQEIYYFTSVPTETTTVQRTVVPPHEIHHSTSAPTELSDLQKFVIKKLSLPLTKQDLQTTIRDIFISMVVNMSPRDPNAIRDPVIALQLNFNQTTRAQLLLLLGNAHFNKMAFKAAIKCYELGLKVTNAPNVYKAVFHRDLGDALLGRMESGDIDTAISLFNEGLKIKHDRIDLVSDLHLILSKAYLLKLKQSSST